MLSRYLSGLLVHITALCPHCNNRYQLDPGLRGKRMYCPNRACRQVFTVQDTGGTNSNGDNHTELLTEAGPGPEQPATSSPDEVKDRQPKSAGSVGQVVQAAGAGGVETMP